LEAKAVVVNVTVVTPSADVTVGLGAGNGVETGTAVVSSHAPIAARAAMAILSVASDGSGTLRANPIFPTATAPAQADLVIDVSGYFQ
jgi:hypothetical protein